jgi:hypothetical protein
LAPIEPCRRTGERVGQKVQVAVLEDPDAAEVGCLLDRDEAGLDELDAVGFTGRGPDKARRI